MRRDAGQERIRREEGRGLVCWNPVFGQSVKCKCEQISNIEGFAAGKDSDNLSETVPEDSHE